MPPKVTVHHEPNAPTPSQEIVRGASAIQTVTDANGRQIGIRKLKALDRMRMFEVLGAENSKNEMYLGYSALAFHVSSIDGETITRPGTKLALEALIQQLGDEGLDAVGEALQKTMKEAASEAERLDQIKN